MKFCKECRDPIYCIPAPASDHHTLADENEPRVCACCECREENTREEEQAEAEQCAYVAGYRDSGAPELLAALESVSTMLEDIWAGYPDRELHQSPAEVRAQMRAAIAKARGA